jgi:hypothetical protein
MASDPGSCEKCSRWKELKEKIRITELLAGMIKGFQERVEKNDLKPTVAEYLKLLQAEQEFEQDAPKEIKVTWVETLKGPSGEK